MAGHVGDRRLAVGAGHRDPVAVRQQLGQHLGPAQDAPAGGAGGRDLLQPGAADGAGVDQQVRAGRVARVVPDRDPDALRGQLTGGGRLTQVAAGHLVAAGDEHPRQRRDAGPPDAHQVHAAPSSTFGTYLLQQPDDPGGRVRPAQPRGPLRHRPQAAGGQPPQGPNQGLDRQVGVADADRGPGPHQLGRVALLVTAAERPRHEDGRQPDRGQLRARARTRSTSDSRRGISWLKAMGR